MSLISRLTARLQNHPKRIVFPEGETLKVLRAAPILVGDRHRFKVNAARLNISLEGIRVIEPERSDEAKGFAEKLAAIQRYGNTNLQGDPAQLALNPNYFACLMAATGGADALISGATTHAASGLRAILQVMPRQQGVETVSSMQILESEEGKFGIDGVLFLADCGVIPDIPAYGQILTGLERPAAEISRGASAHDIFGTAVIVAAQAVDKSYLFPKLKDGPAA